MDVGPGQNVTCTFENAKRGMVEVLKLTNGQIVPPEDMAWSFTLTGPGVSASDTQDESGIIDFDGAKLIPGETYRLCETGIPAGWSSPWTGDTDGDGAPDTTIPFVAGVNNDPVDPTTSYSRVFDPNYVLSGEYANDTRCVNFVVDPGQTLKFKVDNTFPGGEPRTIGFWKNWNTCTGGNQWLSAQENGGPDNGWFTLDDLLGPPHGVTVGIYTYTPVTEADPSGCVEAVRLLDKSDRITDDKKANDAAYDLGSQLIAAIVNLSAGAETCQEVQDAVDASQELLVSLNFDGAGDYLRPKGKDKDIYSYALDLSGTLNEYNNGNLCNGSPGSPPSTAEGYVHISSLIGTASPGSRGRWSVSITIEVRDETNAFVSGAFVSGIWTEGINGSASCTTDGSGTCTIVKNNIKSDVPSVTFSVADVSAAGYLYDPDGLLGGTANIVSTITLSKP